MPNKVALNVIRGDFLKVSDWRHHCVLVLAFHKKVAQSINKECDLEEIL